MHIPDGYLDARVWAPLTVVSAAIAGPCLAAVERRAPSASLPRLGMTAAYLFAAQMINFPVLPGVSGHLLGAALAAILVGPVAATVVMTCVFAVQAFFFQDGGITTLGANLFNMGIAGAWGGYAVYRACGGPERLAVSAGLAAWSAVMLGALLTACELILSGVGQPGLLLTLLLGSHAAIGAGEAALTVGALTLLRQARPDLLEPAAGRWRWLPAAGLVGFALLSPLATPLPDGLGYAAERLGFAARSIPGPLPAVAPDYRLTGLPPGWGSAVGAALLGIGICLLLGLAMARLMATGRQPAPAALSLDPRLKLGFALGLIAAALLVTPQDVSRVGMVCAVAALWCGVGRVSLRWVLTRVALLTPFVALLALNAALGAGNQGSAPAVAVCLKALAALLAMGVFVATTPESEALATLRWFRCPAVLVQLAAFALRYFRVLGEEAGRMLRARAARAGRASLSYRTRAVGAMIGTLFIRSYERAERVALAMQARGYLGPSWAPYRRSLTATDLMATAAFACLLALGCYLR